MARYARTVDERIARIATRQQGVVTWEQLRHAEVSEDEIRGRVARGALIRVHRGVYRVGHAAPSVAPRYLAAVLACGPGAGLSGWAAAFHLRLTRGGRPPRPEVTAPRGRVVPGVITHRTRTVLPVRNWEGIPTTTPPRTILDMSRELSLPDLAELCHHAGIVHKTTPAQVARIAPPNAPRSLMIVLGRRAPVTLSKLERAFLELLRDEGLPLPDHTNRSVDGRRLDCRWVARRLTIELDSYTFHGSRHAWERDRRRDREAYARGDDIRRYTYGDVFEDASWLLAELRGLLLPL